MKSDLSQPLPEPIDYNNKIEKTITILKTSLYHSDADKIFLSDILLNLRLLEKKYLKPLSTGIISNWTTDLEDTRKDEERKQIIDLYLKCKTQTEIANIANKSQSRIAEIIGKFKNEKTDIIPDSLQICESEVV